MGKHKDSKREEVLIAAEEVFLKKGLEGARTAEIARKAGVTHAVLHYWFNTKDGRLQGICSSCILQNGRVD